MKDVEQLLKEYRSEVQIAASSFYAWKNIHNLAADDKQIHKALNSNALSWNLFLHSLQTTFLTTMGRIFDNDHHSLTCRRFIISCQAKIEQFSKSAFEARKLKNANGARPYYLDEYLHGVYEPTINDFQVLSDAVTPHEITYNQNYKKIRNKIIAHKDIATINNKDALFAKTNIGEIEILLQFLHQVEKVIEQFIQNGRMTRLSDHRLNEEKYIRDDIEKLLRKL